ncbi:MAG: hypothetical protein ACI9J2_000865 [Saprospiraceae bacterium]|jgi:hypothetical protein
MNLGNLKQAENQFLLRYAGGFDNPEILELRKKHRILKLVETTQELFEEKNFYNVDQIVAAMVKVVSRSSMVSLFEKPKFRDFVKSLHDTEKEALAQALYEQLYGDQAYGFEQMINLLRIEKLAKWTLVSVIPFYFRPEKEVFVKPTTTKGIIQQLEIELVYKPQPSWAFYKKYRQTINKAKRNVDRSLRSNNAAFCGFLMMSKNL